MSNRSARAHDHAMPGLYEQLRRSRVLHRHVVCLSSGRLRPADDGLPASGRWMRRGRNMHRNFGDLSRRYTCGGWSRLSASRELVRYRRDVLRNLCRLSKRHLRARGYDLRIGLTRARVQRDQRNLPRVKHDLGRARLRSTCRLELRHWRQRRRPEPQPYAGGVLLRSRCSGSSWRDRRRRWCSTTSPRPGFR